MDKHLLYNMWVNTEGVNRQRALVPSAAQAMVHPARDGYWGREVQFCG